MDDPELKTKDTYNRIAEKWATEHNTPEKWQKEYDTFSRLFPKGKILDVGCGGARDYAFFQKGDYDYMGVDYSEGLLQEGRKQFPEAKFVEGDILDLPFGENEFDGFWAIASLLHIPKRKIRKALREIRRVVKRNGIGFIVFKKGKGERVVRDEDDPEDERFFAYWQKEEFQEVLEKSGFELLKFLERPVSEKTIWLEFFVKI